MKISYVIVGVVIVDNGEGGVSVLREPNGRMTFDGVSQLVIGVEENLAEAMAVAELANSRLPESERFDQLGIHELEGDFHPTGLNFIDARYRCTDTRPPGDAGLEWKRFSENPAA